MVVKPKKTSIEKNRAVVLKYHPNAKPVRDNSGWTIALSSIDEDTDDDILGEYLLPQAISEEEAWRLAALSVRTTKNFNRTHPLRIDSLSENPEEKQIRKKDRNDRKLINAQR